MEKHLKIAALQFAFRGDRGETLSKGLELARLAADKGAKLVALPELCSSPWFPVKMSAAGFAWAETIPGPTTDLFSSFASEHGVVVVLPLFEKGGTGRFFNSAAVIDADGNLAGVYRKMHVPHVDGWLERFYFLPPVFHVAGV